MNENNIKKDIALEDVVDLEKQAKDNNAALRNIAKAVMGEALTPAQKECQIYERAIEVYGKDDRLLNAVEKLTLLASTLISARNYKGEDVSMTRLYKQAVHQARAEVNIALNQLDLMLDDCADEEMAAYERLVNEIKQMEKGDAEA